MLNLIDENNKEGELNMVYITGDTHGSIDIGKLLPENWPEGGKLTRDDYLIICGDFGLPFLPTDTSEDESKLRNEQERTMRRKYHRWIKFLSERPYTVLWVDGNHDNHDFWAQQPVTEWHGGLVNVHPDAENVIHLKRGEYYTIDGKTFWTMGGGDSIDKWRRLPGYSWWVDEIPSGEEMNHGLETLKAHNNIVDYIITHTMPQTLVYTALNFRMMDMLQSYFDEIYMTAKFQKWFCGHFHEDMGLAGGAVQIVYKQIVGPL